MKPYWVRLAAKTTNIYSGPTTASQLLSTKTSPCAVEVHNRSPDGMWLQLSSLPTDGWTHASAWVQTPTSDLLRQQQDEIRYLQASLNKATARAEAAEAELARHRRERSFVS
eukprot:TRINITY_DN15660_c2_g1_i1.p2 TRINITY_DN15660_c2_g1~~TRINITY_DN15660_c2_g1_i1.p2  ORF type:complete len:112 (+),score=29.27 TRINITY_DN15660_c2_g1_i1:176-511(+)